MPLVRHFELKDCQIFDEFPTWKNLMFLPVEVRKQAFADPETRQKLRATWQTRVRPISISRWDIVRCGKGRQT